MRAPAAALARYVRTLASSRKDFESLIGAGKSALELGDAQAAAGFFARADDVDPRSPLPQAGMGAVPSPMAIRRPRCPISSGRSSSGPRSRVSPAIAASPTI